MKDAQYHRFVEVVCSRCDIAWLKRQDSCKSWAGLCRSCATKAVAARPEIKAILRENGRRTPPPRQNVRNYRRGADNNLWRGGITPESARVRGSPEMRAWRIAVFMRDSFTCVICDHRGGDLQADHIKPFALFPALRFEIGNGRTLCVECHGLYGARVHAGRLVRASQSGPGRPHYKVLEVRQ